MRHKLSRAVRGVSLLAMTLAFAAPRAIRVDAGVQDATAPTPGTVRENPTDGLKYVWIPPGTFVMGCSRDDSCCGEQEYPADEVTITKGFWLGQTDVTVGAYARFANLSGRQIRSPQVTSLSGGPLSQNMPIVSVDWDDAEAYCRWMGGRLPSEAEWEYAARGGVAESRYGDLDQIAWYSGNSADQAHEVAQKRANGYGLYDMLGSVWQWVNDWYAPNYYVGSPPHDPSGPSGGQDRVSRGGSWHCNPCGVRVSLRLRLPPSHASDVGFRCAGGLVHRTISSLLYSPFSGGGAEAFGDERFDSLGSPR